MGLYTWHDKASGFIPWDDDIDLWMKRRTIQKWLNCFPNGGNKDGLFLNATQTVPKSIIVFMHWLSI